MNYRDRTAVVFLRWGLAYLLLESVWIKLHGTAPIEQLSALFEHWLRSGISEAWLNDLVSGAREQPQLALAVVLATEAFAGLCLAVGLWTRLASCAVGLLYGLRYFVAPDGLALAVVLVAIAVCVSDSGKSLNLLGRRRRDGGIEPQTSSPGHILSDRGP